jgi:hypothetical protein
LRLIAFPPAPATVTDVMVASPVYCPQPLWPRLSNKTGMLRRSARD